MIPKLTSVLLVYAMRQFNCSPRLGLVHCIFSSGSWDLGRLSGLRRLSPEPQPFMLL